MKKWNVPVVEELNIAETANGCLPWLWESCITDNVMDNGNNNGGDEDGSETGKGDNNTPDTLS